MPQERALVFEHRDTKEQSLDSRKPRRVNQKVLVCLRIFLFFDVFFFFFPRGFLSKSKIASSKPVFAKFGVFIWGLWFPEDFSIYRGLWFDRPLPQVIVF